MEDIEFFGFENHVPFLPEDFPTDWDNDTDAQLEPGNPREDLSFIENNDLDRSTPTMNGSFFEQSAFPPVQPMYTPPKHFDPIHGLDLTEEQDLDVSNILWFLNSNFALQNL